MALGDDLLLRIDADTRGAEAGILRANKSLLSYEASVRKAALAAAELDQMLEQDAVQAFQAAEIAAANHARTMKTVGAAMLIAGAAVAFGVGKAVSEFADFDQAMSGVQAATHESAQAMDLLRDAAIQAGAKTQFNARESADAEAELAKAGISTADIIGGALTGSLNLAAAGSLAVADAAGFMATALTQFNLKGDQAAHVADVLAAGAGKAQGEVSDMATALNYAGLPAHALGVSLDETAGALALFAKNGLIGEQAGTGLRGVLASMQAPSQQAKDTLAEYGVTIFDTSGKFIGLAGLAGQLHDKLGGLTDAERSMALGTIFGNQQLQAAQILVDQGAAGIDKWTAAVNDQGYAAQTAAYKMDNLRGDLELLHGSIDTVLIQGGSAANDSLRGLVQTADFLVDAFGNLPPQLQSIGTIMAIGAAAVGVLGGAAILVVPKLEAATAAMAEMGAAGALLGETMTAATSLIFGPLGLVLAAGAIAFGIWAHSAAEAKRDAQEFANTLDPLTGALTDASTALIAKNFSDSGLGDAAKTLGLDVGELAKIVVAGGPVLDDLVAKYTAIADTEEVVASRGHSGASAVSDQVKASIILVDQLQAQHDVIANGIEDWKASKAIQDALGPALDAATGSVQHQSEITETLTERTTDLTESQRSLMERLGLTADAAVALSDSIDEDKAAFDRLNGVNISAIEAQINYQTSLANSASDLADYKKAQDDAAAAGEDFASAVTEGGAAFDLSTEFGRKFSQSLVDQAKDAETVALALETQTGDHKAYQDAMWQTRQDLLKQAEAFGLNEDAAKALVDQILGIPKEATTDVSAPGATQTTQEILDAAAAADGLPPSKLIKIEGDPTDLLQDVDAAQAAIDAMRGTTLTVYLDFKLGQAEYLGGDMDDGQGHTSRGMGGQGRYAQGGSAGERGAGAGTLSMPLDGGPLAGSFAAAMRGTGGTGAAGTEVHYDLSQTIMYPFRRETSFDATSRLARVANGLPPGDGLHNLMMGG